MRKKILLLCGLLCLSLCACSFHDQTQTVTEKQEETEGTTGYTEQTETSPNNAEEYGLTEDGIQYKISYEKDGDDVTEYHAVASWALGDLIDGGNGSYPSLGYDSTESIQFKNGSYANTDGTIPEAEVSLNPPEQFETVDAVDYQDRWLKLTGKAYELNLYGQENYEIYGSLDGQRIWIDGKSFQLCEQYVWYLYDEYTDDFVYVKTYPQIVYTQYGAKQDMYLYDIDQSDNFVEILCCESDCNTIVLRYDGTKLYALGSLSNRYLYRGSEDGLNSYITMGNGWLYEEVQVSIQAGHEVSMILPAYRIEDGTMVQCPLTETEYAVLEFSEMDRYPVLLADGSYGDPSCGTWIVQQMALNTTRDLMDCAIFLTPQCVRLQSICYDAPVRIQVERDHVLPAPEQIYLWGYDSRMGGYCDWSLTSDLYGWYGFGTDDEHIADTDIRNHNSQ